MTGLGAGLASGAPLFEARPFAGGICSSYYMKPGAVERLPSAPEDGEAYRFEIGGGHWIFGGDPLVLDTLGSLVSLKRYVRRSAVYLPEDGLFVPYPLQNNLRYLDSETRTRALAEMARPAAQDGRSRTMAEWLEANFGKTLCDVFFHPFHEAYTAGLWREIAPQDPYKSPVDLSVALEGAFHEPPAVGYNAQFVYPRDGLDALARRMANRCDVRFRREAVEVDRDRRTVQFSDGSCFEYDLLLSTLPLNRMADMAGVHTTDRPHPSPSVLVLNVGGARGERCPGEHWVYLPRTGAGFHRVGFYSNVDSHFLPASHREAGDRVSIYVETAYQEGQKPGARDIDSLAKQTVAQLQDWGWLGEPEVVDPTWIDVAYTWSWPDSDWREQALAALLESNIHQVGRYARWVFQGIADSVADGLLAGAAAGNLSDRA